MTYPTHKERGTDRESAGRGRIAPVIGPVEDPVPTVAAARAVGGESARWAVGTVVAGRFVLQERLGRGRYGRIYKALDRSLSEALIGVEHHVALHELHPRIATQPILLERLENLPFHPHAWSHPNLVKLLEFGRDGAQYFLSEELLEGASVRLVLDENPWEPLTYDEVLAVLRGVGDALNYAHAKGIVHGDLRPQNVFVTANYNIKLLDLLPGNEPRPTPFFPEEMSNDRQPHPSDDVYGLACLAYELLTRRHPYNGNSPLEAVTAGLIPQPVPGLPLPQWQALSRGLALRRERRTAGVPELLAGLGVTGTEILRRGKDARPKPAEAAPPAAAPREAEPEAWPEVTVPPMDARHRGAAVAAAPPAVVIARAPRLEEPSFAKLAFDAETPASTRPRATRRSSPVRMVLGTALVAALAFVAYRDHAQLVIQAADLIETSAAFATEEIAQWQARSASPTRRETSTNAAGGAQNSPPVPRAAPPARRLRCRRSRRLPRRLRPRLLAERTRRSRPRPLRRAQTRRPPTCALPSFRRRPRSAATPTSAPPQFAFAQRTLTVTEGEPSARIEIRRTGSLAEEGSVVWWTADRTALADEDYAVLGARVESFAAGEASKVVHVPLVADSVAEPRESFVVNLRAGRAGAGPATQLEVVVLDDDAR